MSDHNRQTPRPIADLVIAALPDLNAEFPPIATIVDVGCGPTGVWGAAAQRRWPTASVAFTDVENYGKELQEAGLWDGEYHGNYRNAFYQDDFVRIPYWSFRLKVDLWITNPPYPKAELFFWQMIRFSGPTSKIAMFLNAGWLEGKHRRNKIFDVIPPNLIIHLDGRIVDKTHPEESGTDQRGRVTLYWDFACPVKPGETRCRWVGSDKEDDYRVIVKE